MDILFQIHYVWVVVDISLFSDIMKKSSRQKTALLNKHEAYFFAGGYQTFTYLSDIES